MVVGKFKNSKRISSPAQEIYGNSPYWGKGALSLWASKYPISHCAGNENMDKETKERIQEAISQTLNADIYEITDQREIEGKDGKFTIVSILEKTSGMTLDFYEREVLGFSGDGRIRIRKSAYARAVERAKKRIAENPKLQKLA